MSNRIPKALISVRSSLPLASLKYFANLKNNKWTSGQFEGSPAVGPLPAWHSGQVWHQSPGRVERWGIALCKGGCALKGSQGRYQEFGITGRGGNQLRIREFPEEREYKPRVCYLPATPAFGSCYGSSAKSGTRGQVPVMGGPMLGSPGGGCWGQSRHRGAGPCTDALGIYRVGPVACFLRETLETISWIVPQEKATYPYVRVSLRLSNMWGRTSGLGPSQAPKPLECSSSGLQGAFF